MSQQDKILIAPSSFAAHDKSPLNRLIEKGYQVCQNPFGRKLTKEELIKLLPGVAGIVAGLEPLDEEVLRKSSLKVISRCGSGISNVDVKAAKDLSIKVRLTPTGPVESVAELTTGMMICLVRGVARMNQDLHNRKWVKITGVQIQGKNIVIIGLGKIGRRIANLLKAFHVNIYAVDPNIKEKSVEGIPVVSLDEALQCADIITMHSSGDELILGKQEFLKIKPGAFLLNSARGSQVDEPSLMEALDRKIIAGAWFDAFPEEPYKGPLTKYPQVLLTPHIGSYTFECRKEMEMEAVNNLIAAFEEA